MARSKAKETNMPNYAVIDLGSNSIRLVVYEVRDDKKRCYTCKDFKSLINDKDDGRALPPTWRTACSPKPA